MVAAPRNVVYVQGPYYDAGSTLPFPHNQSAKSYFSPVLALPHTVFTLCFGHFNAKANYENNGWGLVINNVAATDSSMATCMAPIKAATASGATVLLSIGGWENPQDWKNIIDNPSLCAQQVADFLNAYGMQGIDIDNEDVVAGADGVGTFIAELAAKVNGLIVSCSPMESQMEATGFYNDLVASAGGKYIQWYNIQYYQNCTPFLYQTFEPEFVADVGFINGWYDSKLENPGSYAVIGAAPMQCNGQSPALLASVMGQLAANKVSCGGVAWWNYPAMMPSNLEEESWGQHAQEAPAAE